jgi:Predicted transcriptional regulators
MSNIFGNKIKDLRESKNLPQRKLASELEVDTATYCKIEKGDRRAKREQVILIADLLSVDKDELLKLWSADRVYEILENEDNPSQILSIVAENIVGYQCEDIKI